MDRCRVYMNSYSRRTVAGEYSTWAIGSSIVQSVHGSKPIRYSVARKLQRGTHIRHQPLRGGPDGVDRIPEDALTAGVNSWRQLEGTQTLQAECQTICSNWSKTIFMSDVR